MTVAAKVQARGLLRSGRIKCSARADLLLRLQDIVHSKFKGFAMWVPYCYRPLFESSS